METASNADRLADAGLITTTDLPEPYKTVIEELSDEEVDALVSAKNRLDDAYQAGQDSPEATPHYGEFFVPF
jgi:hypothetical protein